MRFRTFSESSTLNYYQIHSRHFLPTASTLLYLLHCLNEGWEGGGGGETSGDVDGWREEKRFARILSWTSRMRTAVCLCFLLIGARHLYITNFLLCIRWPHFYNMFPFLHKKQVGCFLSFPPLVYTTRRFKILFFKVMLISANCKKDIGR
jgi:hypothetical protein